MSTSAPTSTPAAFQNLTRVQPKCLSDALNPASQRVSDGSELLGHQLSPPGGVTILRPHTTRVSEGLEISRNLRSTAQSERVPNTSVLPPVRAGFVTTLARWIQIEVQSGGGEV